MLGLGFGILVTSYGFPWWLAPLVSATVFAGSLEFLLVGLLAVGTPLVTVAVTTLLVNARHLFYGLTFPLDRLRGPRWRGVRGRLARAYAVYVLCDESFAIVSTHKDIRGSAVLWVDAGLHLSWAGGAALGGLLGAGLLGDVPGLDFILTALFIVLAMDAWQTLRDRATLVVVAVSGAIGTLTGHDRALLVSMCVFVGLTLLRHRRRRRRATADGAPGQEAA